MGVGNKKQQEAHDKVMNKSKGFGTIKEQPIEVVAMNTPPRAAKGADRKTRERRAVRVSSKSKGDKADQALDLLLRNYRAKRQPRKYNGDVANKVQAMLNYGKAVGAKGDADFNTGKKRKGDAPQGRNFDDYFRIQAKHRGIDISDML